MKALLFAASFFLVGAALAQQAPSPAPAPEQKAPPERRPLNLKLDESARSYVRETQPDTKGADNLPTLGGGSTSFERQPRDLRPDAASRATPYPTDSENSNRK